MMLLFNSQNLNCTTLLIIFMNWHAERKECNKHEICNKNPENFHSDELNRMKCILEYLY